MDKFGLVDKWMEYVDDDSMVEIKFEIESDVEYDRINFEVNKLVEGEIFTFESFEYLDYKIILRKEEYYMLKEDILYEKYNNDYLYKLKVYNLEKMPKNIDSIIEDRNGSNIKYVNNVNSYTLYNLIKILFVKSCSFEQTKQTIFLQLKNFNHTLDDSMFILTKTLEKIIKIIQNTNLIYTYNTKKRLIDDYNKKLLNTESIFSDTTDAVLNDYMYMCEIKEGQLSNLFIHNSGIWIMFKNRTCRLTMKIGKNEIIGKIFSGKLLKSKFGYNFEVYECLTDFEDNFTAKMKKRDEYISFLNNTFFLPNITIDTCKYKEYTENESCVCFSKLNSRFCIQKKSTNRKIYLIYIKGTINTQPTLICKQGTFIGTPTYQFTMQNNVLPTNFNFKYSNQIIEFNIIEKNNNQFLHPVSYRFDKSLPSSNTKWNKT